MEPKRKCITCGEIKSRKELLKITKDHSNGNIIVEPDSKTFGRSAYVCKNKECIENAFKKKRLTNILKTSNSIDKESIIYSLLNKI